MTSSSMYILKKETEAQSTYVFIQSILYNRHEGEREKKKWSIHLDINCTNGLRWDVEQMHSRRQYFFVFFSSKEEKKKKETLSSHVEMNDRLMTSVFRDCPGECRKKRKLRVSSSLLTREWQMIRSVQNELRSFFYVIWKMNNILSINAFEISEWFNRLLDIVIESLNRL